MKKRALSILLALCMVLSLLPVMAQAATGGTFGENLTWTLEDGTLTISGSGEMPNFQSVTARPWHNSRGSITTVKIEYGVTSIGNQAFYYCFNLTSVIIPNSVTSIGESAFMYCDELTSVSIPGSVTSIGSYAFSSCSRLTSVTILDGTTSIGRYTFSWCSGLTSVTIPDSVTSIGEYAFYKCSGLTGVIIPNSVTSIGSAAFLGCSGLTSITIPDGVTSIGSDVFAACSGLTEIKVSAQNLAYSDIDGVLFDKKRETLIACPAGRQGHYGIPPSVTSIGNSAFLSCAGLTSVMIPDSVTSIEMNAFCHCSGLTNVTIPDSVASIGDSAFSDCYGLTDVTIPSSVTSIEPFTFYCCTGLTSITIPNSVTSIGDDTFCECSGLTSVTIPDSVTSIGNRAFSGCTGLTSAGPIGGGYDYEFGWKTEIPAYAFRYCKGLTSVTIPEGVTSIGPCAFSDCTGLTSVTIPNGVTSIEPYTFSGCTGLTSITILNSVTSIGQGAFRDCSSLTDVTIPSSVTSIEPYTFYGCSGLTSVTIPNSITRIGDCAFRDCTGLTDVTIPNGVTSIGDYAFDYCTGLTSITIPSSITRIGDCAFRDCSSLTDVTIPSSVTSIEPYTFYCCTGLTSITIPNSVTSIGEHAFRGCNGLTSVIIGNSVASIGEYAFNGCSSLTSVSIPGSVISIGKTAFYGCSHLTNVYYAGSEADWKLISIGGYNTPLTNATRYYNCSVSGGNGNVSGGNSISIYQELPCNLTVVVSENTKSASSQKDKYQLSNEAELMAGTSTAKTKKDGVYQITSFSSLNSLSISKSGFASVTRTQEQLKDHPEIYLEPVTKGVPTVTAVWLDGVDIRHFKSSVDLLGTHPVTITADVAWDSAKGTGTIKLVQGSKAAEFSGNTLTMTLKDKFDVSETIYIWAGYDSKNATMKPLKLEAATAAGSFDKFKVDFGDNLNFTLPNSVPLLGGTKMGVGLYSNIPVTISIEDGKIYAAIGFQKDGEYDKNTGWTAKSFAESVQNLKGSLKSAGSAVEQYKRVQDAMKAFHEKFRNNFAAQKGSFGADAGFNIVGFAEGYLDESGTPHWLDTGMIISVSGGINYSIPFYIGPVPLFFETSLSAEASAQLNLLIQEAAKSFTPNGVIEGSITLSGGLGVGIKKVASLSGGLEGELKHHWEIILNGTDYNRTTAKLKAYAKVSVLFFSGSKKWDLAEKTWEWLDRASLQSFSAEPYASLYDDLYDPGIYALMSTEEMTDNSVFLANNAAVLFSSESGGTGEAPFAANVYSQSKPQLAAFSDGTLLAVWTGLDNSRATYDRPRLYYALRTDGTWSDPAPVNTAGMYMEADPALTIVNDVAYLAWDGANSAMGTPASMDEAAEKLDIFAASFDRASGRWAVSTLSQDQTADYSPVIGGGPGGIAVVWQRNSANDLFGGSGTNSVSGCQYVDGAWKPLSTRYDNVGEIVDLSIDMSENIPHIVWTQAETEDTYAVYLDGARYASGSGALFDNSSLYWYQDGHLYQDGQDTGVALDTDRFQIDNGTLLHLSGNGLYSTLMAHYYDNSTGLWSDAVALTDGQQSIGSFSAASVGTSLKVLAASTEVLKELDAIQSDEDDPYGSTNLVLLENEPSCDLSIGDPWYLEDTYTAGSTMTFYLDVTNSGTVPTNYMVSVSGAAGTTYNTISRQKLLPGCTEEVAIVYTQGEVLDSQLTFTVKALDGGEDTNPSDNQTGVTLQYEDVAVEHIGNGVTEDGQYLVYADIVNRGHGIQSDVTVSLYLDAVSDKPLQTVTVGPLTSMASQPVSFQVPAPADQACYVIAATSSGTDMNTATDSDFTVCTSQESTLIQLISVDGNRVELSLENVPAGTLVVAAYDGNGKMDSVGMSNIQTGTTAARIAMQNAVPAGDSLVAFVLDTATQEPLMRRVDLS